MAVDGNRAIIVLDADPLPETGGRAGVDDSAAHRREDRGTHDVGDVDTRVEGSQRTPEPEVKVPSAGLTAEGARAARSFWACPPNGTLRGRHLLD